MNKKGKEGESMCVLVNHFFFFFFGKKLKSFTKEKDRFDIYLFNLTVGESQLLFEV